MRNALIEERQTELSTRLGKPVRAIPQTIGNGFTASHFSEQMFNGRMDPLLMVDHFVMTAPTFDPHLHSGISAVTAMFEDSQGEFLNRDTLGHNIALNPGDLYWLAAASGAVHEEKPADGARTHALQIFVDLPTRLKREPARAFHVEAKDVPIIEGPGYRVRVVLGSSGGVVGAQGSPEEMTLLDAFLESHGTFSHPLPAGRQAWIYAVSGEVTLNVAGERCTLDAGKATTVAVGPEAVIAFDSTDDSHFVLLAGHPIR